MIAQILSGTVLLVMAYLILSHSEEFGTAAKATGAVYTESVRTLQGR
jgi:hypothetical protein